MASRRKKTPSYLALTSLSLQKRYSPIQGVGLFNCEFISKRGTKVWTGYVSPDLLIMKGYCCQFMATKDIQDACDHVPGTVQPEVVVAGDAEIMEL